MFRVPSFLILYSRLVRIQTLRVILTYNSTSILKIRNGIGGQCKKHSLYLPRFHENCCEAKRIKIRQVG